MAATKILTEAVGQVLANKIKANTSAIDVLNGTGTGSVSKTVADEIAKVVASAPADFDTLKEISDWISSHSTDAASMNSRITANETAIAALEAGTITVDAALSATSENPVQNKAVKAAIDELDAKYELVTAAEAEAWFTPATP